MRPYRLIGLSVALVLAFMPSSFRLKAEAPPAGAVPQASASTGTGPFDSLHFRSIGPAAMSGRISDLAVYEPNPAIFYVGTAHGGVWKTTNNGTTFEAQFQNNGLMSIGDVTVSQSNPDLIWVGTGEANNRQSTSWGDGVYKSTDGGKTYTSMGLKTTRAINRIVIDPRNNETVFVASPGSLFGPGGERGVYKTTDGGKTWKQSLKVDDDTGANDLVMDPTNSQVLWASTYQRRRTACCMNGGGPGSGIWKTTDGGETWTRMKAGIPEGSLGRIALDVYRKHPNVLYSLIEGPAAGRGRGPGAFPAPPEEAAGAAGGGGQGGGRGGGGPLNADPTGLYRSDDAGVTWRKVNNANPRPMYFSQVRVDPNDDEVVIFGGVDLQMSLDGGKTVNTQAASTIHSDHHAIWIDPSNSSHVIIGNDGGLAASYDQAKTWVFFPNLPVGLFYHVSVDNAIPYNVCGGMQDNYDWCGPSQVRGSAGIANYEWTTVQGGDGFVTIQDPTDYRIAYSESQDGNMVRLDRVTGESISIRPQPGPGEPPFRWNWDTPLVFSPHDPKVLYAAGNKIFKSTDRGLTWTAISGDITGAVNRDDVVTMGVKGSDIGVARNDGIQANSTITTFAESPKRSGVYYAGTDDGHITMSRDSAAWKDNMYSRLPGAPPGAWISKVAPSKFDEGTVYSTIDAHRQDDYGTYMYVSHDFGQTWQSIAANLKDVTIKTITEDPKNPDVLYAGAETGLYVSIDRGKSWNYVRANLPSVRIDEIVVHPRDNALVLATHGRAIWILDRLEPIQEYAAAQAKAADAHLFTPPPTAMFRRPARDKNYEFWGSQTFFGENPPQAAVISWYQKKPVGDLKIQIKDAAGREVREISGPVLENYNKAGIHSACWDLRVQAAPNPTLAAEGAPGRGGRQGGGGGGGAGGGGGGRAGGQNPPADPFGAGCGGGGGRGGGGGGGGAAFGAGGGGNPGPFALPGTYQVALVVDGKAVDTKPLKVAADPEVVLTELERKRMYDQAMEMHDLQKRGAPIATDIATMTRQVAEIKSALGSRSDVPADVKTSFEAFDKELTVLAPKWVQPPGAGGRGGGGGGGGRGGGAGENVLAQAGQAKNGLTAGMLPGEQTTRAYNDAKTKFPKAVAEANALFTKAGPLSASLAKYNLTLTAPPQIATPATKPTDKKSEKK
jgi:photosystem II stability/assembly factor-like uncharacterized protein